MEFSMLLQLRGSNELLITYKESKIKGHVNSRRDVVIKTFEPLNFSVYYLSVNKRWFEKVSRLKQYSNRNKQYMKHGAMVIIVRNGLGDTSSNPGRD